VFGDDVMAAALIDRVLHHCHLVNIRGNSYRMREHTELYRALQPEVDTAPRPSGALAGPGQPATETLTVCNLQPPELRNLRPALTARGLNRSRGRGASIWGWCLAES